MFGLTSLSENVGGYIYNNQDVPTWGHPKPQQYGGLMQIEIHLIRGDANTVLEFEAYGNLKVSIQMGRPQDEVIEQCAKVVDPGVLKRIIRLWCDPDHPRLMIESGRNLIIREIS